MIVYDLICRRQHRFEGWFASAEDFARQRESTLIRCPLCDDAAIERRPSANVQVGRAAAPAVDHGEDRAESRKEVAVAGGDGHVLKLMRRLIAETENVARAFPEEARKIHYEEAPKRGIRRASLARLPEDDVGGGACRGVRRGRGCGCARSGSEAGRTPARAPLRDPDRREYGLPLRNAARRQAGALSLGQAGEYGPGSLGAALPGSEPRRYDQRQRRHRGSRDVRRRNHAWSEAAGATAGEGERKTCSIS